MSDHQSNFLNSLEKASLFELWRLNAVIHKMLNDPHRLMQIHARLRLGQRVSYFLPDENREAYGIIERINRTKVIIRDEALQKRWSIPLYMVNLDGIPTDIKTDRQKVDRLTLKVGDRVWFINHRDNNIESFGVVTKLNAKTASVRLNNGEQWRVSYSGLFYVLEGESASKIIALK